MMAESAAAFEGDGAGASAGAGRPREPGPEECCGRGCETCVWSLYTHELAAWKRGEGREGRREEEGGGLGEANTDVTNKHSTK